MNLQAMTREKLQFLLPVVFTVGPDVNQRGESAGQAPRDAHDASQVPEDRGDALMKYAMLLAEAEHATRGETKGQHIDNIVKGIIEGETRVLVSSMTMEEVSNKMRPASTLLPITFLLGRSSDTDNIPSYRSSPNERSSKRRFSRTSSPS